ncbi:MAG: ABC-F family ATP-binding cassette domain-containing protein [Clostridium sp.]|nr:ABC-F family ATP-binding cassette domain-containing protein [Clostridium sp.]
MILSCSNITKSFGTDTILDHVSFHIEEREKAAIVGINGAGKSTLLKIIVGELTADEGNVTISRGKTLGYLAQHQDIKSNSTIYDELMEVKRPILEMEQQIRSLEHRMKSSTGEELEALLETYSRLNHEFERINGYAWQSEITGVLKGLGFTEEEFSKPVRELSGGQKTRVSLGKLLLSKPDIILLDEPTNHLDMESIAWLENYLMNYSGTVLIVAHDRYFLDRVVSKIVELDGGRATTFLGNYSAYGEKKAIIRAGIMKAWLNQQQEIKHQEEVITKLRSFNREKSIKRAESREKLLNKMEILEKPTELNDAMNITLEPCVVSGNDVLTVRGLSKRFDNNQLFSNVDFDIRRGERIAIIGNNGTGKTTILKIINGLLSPDEGEIKVGSKVHIGYYDQEHQVLHMDKTVFEEIQDTYPDMNNTQVRNVLAAFLFTGDDVFKLIRDLSGGERGRVSLAKLMLSETNFLILDEPTNHLDITSKEILENALVNYTGTVLYVSHDRYFINKTATRILDLKMGTLLNYIGNYDYYLEKKDAVELAYTSKAASIPAAKRSLTGQQPASGQGIFIGQKASGQKASVTPASDSAAAAVTPEKLDWKQQKEEQARLRKRQNDLKKVEESIQNLESRDQEIDTLLCDATVFSDVSRLMQLQKEKEEIAKELESLYEKWEELAE